MFSKTCLAVRRAVYGVMGTSDTTAAGTVCSYGTAFMVAPGVLVTAGHMTHVNNDWPQPYHQRFEAVRAPDIGSSMETAFLLAVDPVRDIALFRMERPRSSDCLTLSPGPVMPGTSCGSLGFPLSTVDFLDTGRRFNLVERFQGSFISSFYMKGTPSGVTVPCYEMDALMYGGSSGCPVFLLDGTVIGMQVASQIGTEDLHEAPYPSPQSVRLAISVLVPSYELLAFARANGIQL